MVDNKIVFAGAEIQSLSLRDQKFDLANSLGERP